MGNLTSSSSSSSYHTVSLENDLTLNVGKSDSSSETHRFLAIDDSIYHYEQSHPQTTIVPSFLPLPFQLSAPTSSSVATSTDCYYHSAGKNNNKNKNDHRRHFCAVGYSDGIISLFNLDALLVNSSKNNADDIARNNTKSSHHQKSCCSIQIAASGICNLRFFPEQNHSGDDADDEYDHDKNNNNNVVSIVAVSNEPPTIHVIDVRRLVSFRYVNDEPLEETRFEMFHRNRKKNYSSGKTDTSSFSSFALFENMIRKQLMSCSFSTVMIQNRNEMEILVGTECGHVSIIKKIKNNETSGVRFKEVAVLQSQQITEAVVFAKVINNNSMTLVFYKSGVCIGYRNDDNVAETIIMQQQLLNNNEKDEIDDVLYLGANGNRQIFAILHSYRRIISIFNLSSSGQMDSSIMKRCIGSTVFRFRRRVSSFVCCNNTAQGKENIPSSSSALSFCVSLEGGIVIWIKLSSNSNNNNTSDNENDSEELCLNSSMICQQTEDGRSCCLGGVSSPTSLSVFESEGVDSSPLVLITDRENGMVSMCRTIPISLKLSSSSSSSFVHLPSGEPSLLMKLPSPIVRLTQKTPPLPIIDCICSDGNEHEIHFEEILKMNKSTRIQNDKGSCDESSSSCLDEVPLPKRLVTVEAYSNSQKQRTTNHHRRNLSMREAKDISEIIRKTFYLFIDEDEDKDKDRKKSSESSSSSSSISGLGKTEALAAMTHCIQQIALWEESVKSSSVSDSPQRRKQARIISIGTIVEQEQDEGNTDGILNSRHHGLISLEQFEKVMMKVLS